jgi:hypothetical protein
MVIFEGAISTRFFLRMISEKDHREPDQNSDQSVEDLYRSHVAYFFLQVLFFNNGKPWDLLATPMGNWFLLEQVVLVYYPVVLYFLCIQEAKLMQERLASIYPLLCSDQEPVKCDDNRFQMGYACPGMSRPGWRS